MPSSNARQLRRRKIQYQKDSCPARLPENPDIEMRWVDGMGRGLFWCPTDGRVLAKGTTLLRLEPEIIVPDDDAIFTHCHVCFSDDQAALKICSGCELVRYCSQKCREADQPLHTEECQCLSTFYSFLRVKEGEDKFKKAMITTVNRMTARLLWKGSIMGGDWWKPIYYLNGHERDKAYSEDGTPRQLALYLNPAALLKNADKDLVTGVEVSRNVLNRVRTNLFSFGKNSSKSRVSIGAAMCAVGALINHSCIPNLDYDFQDDSSVQNCMHFQSIKEIQPGEQLFIAYVDPNQPALERQEVLLKNYGIQCKCLKCKTWKLAHDKLVKDKSTTDIPETVRADVVEKIANLMSKAIVE